MSARSTSDASAAKARAPLMIRAFLFDIGNVLVTFDFSRATRRLSEHSHLTPDEVRPRLMPLVAEMECGRLSSGEFVEQAMAACGFGGTHAAFEQAYAEIFEENAAMTPLVERLAAKYPLFHLSNTGGIHLAYLQAKYPVFRHFQGGAYSHLSGSMKPEAKIYHDAVALTGCRPEEIVYLDDAPANTAAGAELGLNVFTYDWQSHHVFEAWLASLNVTF